MYSAKLNALSTLILICSMEVAEVVFKAATKYTMLSDEKVWITFEYDEPENGIRLPHQLITIREDRLTKASYTEQSVVDIALNVMRAFRSQRNVLPFSSTHASKE